MKMDDLLVNGFLKTSMLDYPGKIAMTVFLAGCNFRCHFCHNPELVLPHNIKDLEMVPEEHFFKLLDDRKKYIDTVCVTGGEPTLYDDLAGFISKIKGKGFLAGGAVRDT